MAGGRPVVDAGAEVWRPHRDWEVDRPRLLSRFYEERRPWSPRAPSSTRAPQPGWYGTWLGVACTPSTFHRRNPPLTSVAPRAAGSFERTACWQR